jgi:hypothetical protein
MTTTTIENGITVYTHQGKKYRLANKSDIGKPVYVSDSTFQFAIDKPSRTLRDYNEMSREFPYTTTVGWRLAYVEIESGVEFVERVLRDDEIIQEGDMYRESPTLGLSKAIQSVDMLVSHAKGRWGFGWQWVRKEPVKANPDWLPEGARILRDDEVIKEGDMYYTLHSGYHYKAYRSVGHTPATACDPDDVSRFAWYRPASAKADELKAAMLDYIKTQAAQDEATTNAIKAAATLRSLLKGPDRFVAQNGDKLYLFTVKADNSFNYEEVKQA